MLPTAGGDELAGFEGVEAEEEVMLQKAGMQPWEEPGADGGPPGGAGTPPFVGGTAGATGMGLSPQPPPPLHHSARPPHGRAPSTAYSSRGPTYAPAAAVADEPPFPPEHATGLGHGRLQPHGSVGGPGSSGRLQPHSSMGGPAAFPSEPASSMGHGRVQPDNPAGPGSVGSALGQAHHHQGGYGGVPPSHAGAPHQPVSHGGALPSFLPTRSSWRGATAAAAGGGQPHPPSPQPLAGQQVRLTSEGR
eukprot:1151081-Pelagomonas_calceolata.AAC.2